MMCSSCVDYDDDDDDCGDCDDALPWDFDDADVGARPDTSAPPARARSARAAAAEADEDNDDDYVPSEADDEEEPNSADEYSPVHSSKAARTASSASGGAAAAVAPAAGSGGGGSGGGGGGAKDALGELDDLQEELDWIRSTLEPTNSSGWLDRPVLRRGRRAVLLRSDPMDLPVILYDRDGGSMAWRHGTCTDQGCGGRSPFACLPRPPEVQRATDRYWLAPGNLGKVLDAAPLCAPSASDAPADAGASVARLRHRAAYMQRLMTALLLPAGGDPPASA